MTKSKIHEIAYKLNERLLSEINHKNLNSLNSNYGINTEVFVEIEKTINSIGVDLENTFLKMPKSLKDFFEYDDGGYGIEVDLITQNGDETDLTLTTELNKTENGYKLGYRLIEVM